MRTVYIMCLRYICIDRLHGNDKSGMYTVYCRYKLFDDFRRRVVYIMR